MISELNTVISTCTETKYRHKRIEFPDKDPGTQVGGGYSQVKKSGITDSGEITSDSGKEFSIWQKVKLGPYLRFTHIYTIKIPAGLKTNVNKVPSRLLKRDQDSNHRRLISFTIY